MAPTEHDKRVAAALVPITSSMQALTDQLTYLCSDLGLGTATSEQRLRVDRECAEVAGVLMRLRRELIPAVPGLVHDGDERS